MIDLLSRAAGSVLGGVFGAAARVRPATKPLHPRGHVAAGVLERRGLHPPVGVPWLDEPGTDAVLVRRSKSAGLPGHLPDVHGLTVRVRAGGTRHGDLLLATTGTRPVTRHLLVPTTSDRRPMTTLMPYRTPSGPVVLAAFPHGDDAGYDLAVATLTGPWRTFASLAVDDTPDADAGDGPDVDLRFDPVVHPLPGLGTYAWVSRLREPAYAAARRRSPAPARSETPEGRHQGEGS
ncbi:hypothetical protein [Thalassiella azotivora]